jgi:hypothetical protein
MRPSKYFYDKPLPKELDLKTVLIYRPHPVHNICNGLVERRFYVRTLCRNLTQLPNFAYSVALATFHLSLANPDLRKVDSNTYCFY